MEKTLGNSILSKQESLKVKEVFDALRREKPELQGDLFKVTERYSFGWVDPRGIFGKPDA